jgi:hypothetical protein
LKSHHRAGVAQANVRPMFFALWNLSVLAIDAFDFAAFVVFGVLLTAVVGIEFGNQAAPDCRTLYDTLTQNADLAATLRQNFVLLLVDTDYHDAGEPVLRQFVPKTDRGKLPLLTVNGPDEHALNTTDTTDLKSGEHYAADKLKAFLEKWAAKK